MHAIAVAMQHDFQVFLYGTRAHKVRQHMHFLLLNHLCARLQRQHTHTYTHSHADCHNALAKRLNDFARDDNVGDYSIRCRSNVATNAANTHTKTQHTHICNHVHTFWLERQHCSCSPNQCNVTWPTTAAARIIYWLMRATELSQYHIRNNFANDTRRTMLLCCTMAYERTHTMLSRLD